MEIKEIQLSRKDELDILINTSIEVLKDVKESKLALNIVKWSEERKKLLLLELINVIIERELKITTYSVINGKAKQELQNAYREGEKVGYNNALDKLKKVKEEINNLIII